MRTLYVLLCLLGAIGCVRRAASDEPIRPIAPVPLIDSVKARNQTLTLNTPASLIDAITAVIGEENQAELKLARPITVTGQAGAITVESGTELLYRKSGQDLTISFTGKVKPIIEAKIFGFDVRPQLTDVILRPDGSGSATGQALGITRTKPFNLRWGEDQTLGSMPPTKPVVWLYTATWCGQCAVQKAELKRHGELPFILREVDVSHGGQPSHIPSLPYFHWTGRDGKSWGSNWAKVVIDDLSSPRPQASISNGPRWSFSGGDTKSSLIQHLLNDGIHRGKFDRGKLERLSREQLVQLHSADHNSAEKKR